MEDVTKHINRVLGYKTWSDKRKIDSLLEYDCNMYTRLGTDSTKMQKEETKKKSRAIYRAIKEIDYDQGKDYLWQMD